MMSSKRIPGDGQSGNWRSPFFSFTSRRASSAGPEAAVVETPPWVALELLLPTVVAVAPCEWSRDGGEWMLVFVGSGAEAGG